jgi:hypothetical protein
MKTIAAYLIITVCSVGIIAQNSNSYVFQNREMFRGYGVIFTAEYKSNIILKNKQTLYTPSKNEIEQAEVILRNRYNIDLTTIAWFKPLKNVKKAYYKYNRQYLAYIDLKGNRKIIINMLKFSCKKKSIKKFERWDSQLFVGFGEYYEYNVKTFEVDLDNHRLKLF